MSARPTVSIGLPVYNGARFLAQALDSLLAQEYEDFELIIADNASTDETGQIARQYAARDPRIKYDRAEKTRYTQWNFNRVCEMASGEYFMWASCHDLWHRRFISALVDIMQRDASVVLCFPAASEIDEQDGNLGLLRGGLDTRGLDAPARFRKTVRKITGYSIYGLFRAKAVQQVLPAKPSLGPDAMILAEMSFFGAFAFVNEDLFSLRRMSVSSNWKRYFDHLHLKSTPWNFFRLYGMLIGDYLALVRKYAVGPSQRASLGAWAVMVLLMRTFLWGLGIIVSKFFPKFYRPF